MCGFAGIWFADKSKTVNSELLEKITNVIQHRGPDDSGYHVAGNLGLGFRRLSIIDIGGGHQPMRDSESRAWIVFNGEIYNYKDLRKELTAKGYQFKTQSDTEVMLNAYLEYGDSFVNKLRGMFSFAIYDIKLDKLTIGRDRFGIKPLHYLIANNVLVFGSEMKSILESGYSKREIDHTAVDSYFSYGYILSPNSIFKDIKKVRPGHIATITLNSGSFNIKEDQYWKPSFRSNETKDFSEYKLLIKEKLKETVNYHLESDVTVGAFLSGGIDSNSVVSTMVKLIPDKVRTFSIGFDDSEYDESKLAKRSAQIYGTNHTELYLEPNSCDIIDKIVGIYDEPFGDSSAIPTYFVSKLAAESVKVVLSGDGGDEFFGGYKEYQRLLRINKYKSLLKISAPILKVLASSMPSKMKGKRFAYSLTHNTDLIHAMSMEINKLEKKNFFSKEFYENKDYVEAYNIKSEYIKNSISKDFISKQMELDILTYMTDDILTKVDRASMANSLEVRVPLIDHEFFELASQIPSEMKINGNTGKYIFREAVKDQIPDFIYNKPKTGFTIPIAKWFKGDLSDYLINSLENAKDTGLIDPSYIDELLNAKNIGSMVTRIWPIVVFSNWHKKNIN